MNEDLEGKVEIVLDWLKAGMSITAAAALSGFSATEIVGLANNGVVRAPSLPQTTHRYLEDRNLEVVTRYEAGKRQVDIGNAMKMGGAYVSQICTRYGADREKHRANREFRPRKGAYLRDPEICAMYQSGKTLDECGKSFKVTREWIRQILVRNGIEERHGGFFKPERVEVRQRKVAADQVRQDIKEIRVDERQQARALYNAGATYKEISEKLNHPITWVQIAIWKTGGPSRNPRTIGRARPRLTPEQRQEIARRYGTGESSVAIGKDFDIVPPYVQHVAMNLGVKRPMSGPSPLAKVTAEQKDEIGRRYAAGEALRALAEAFGLSESYTYCVARLSRHWVRKKAWHGRRPAEQTQASE